MEIKWMPVAIVVAESVQRKHTHIEYTSRSTRTYTYVFVKQFREGIQSRCSMCV
jgi:hypothetical protein